MATPAEVIELFVGLRDGSTIARARGAAEVFRAFASLTTDQKRELALLVADRAAPQLVPRIEAETGLELSREHGFRIVWLELPAIRAPVSRRGGSHREVLLALGFENLDVSDTFAGRSPHELQVAPWDKHPNAFAHGLIAERVYDLLLPMLADRAIGVAGASDADVL